MKDADVVMLCVSADKGDSFNNIKKWHDEVKAANPGCPVVLVLCKKDLPNKVVTFDKLK